MAVLLAEELGMYVDGVWNTVDGLEATNEEILDEYLAQLYKNKADADKLIEAAKRRVTSNIATSKKN